MVESNEAPGKILVKGLILAIFDDKLGPVSQAWLPSDLSPALLEKIPMAVYNIGSSTQEIPKGLAVLPVPGMPMKALVQFIQYKAKGRRGGVGEGALILLIDELNDAIFYRYFKEFEDLFEKHAASISTMLESKAKDYALSADISSFFDELLSILDMLKNQELSPNAFPEDEELEAEETLLKCKIAVIGDPNVGKTSVIMQFTEKAFRRSYLPTIGVNISEKTISHEGKSVKFVIWDVGGQVKFQNMRKHFYAGSNAVIFVIDLTNKESLANIKGWYDDVKKSISGTFNAVLLGNKCDLVDQIVITRDEAGAVANELNLPYFQTSALTGENIDVVFDYFASDVIEHSSG